MVSFAQMNLVQPVYIGKLDCIFCMNVLMYFSEERRNSLIQSFYDYLEPGGYLLLGHSESLSQVPVTVPVGHGWRLQDVSETRDGSRRANPGSGR